MPGFTIITRSFREKAAKGFGTVVVIRAVSSFDFQSITTMIIMITTMMTMRSCTHVNDDVDDGLITQPFSILPFSIVEPGSSLFHVVLAIVKYLIASLRPFVNRHVRISPPCLSCLQQQ